MLRVRHHLHLLMVIAAIAACDRPSRQPVSDTTSTRVEPPPPDTVVQQPRVTTWDISAGPALFVHPAAGSPAGAVVVLPDVSGDTLADTTTFDPAALRNVSLEMFTRAGRVGQARLGRVVESADGGACLLWPTAPLLDSAGSWTVGFQAGRARPLPVDSIESLASTDSARLAADLTRIASALPNDTASALRGIPFSVRSAYRFSPAPGVQAIAAHIVRKLTIEANPAEEHIFLIAESDSGSTVLRPAYYERASGSEENVETTDALALLRIGSNNRPTIVLERSGDAARAFSLLQRVGARQWRLRWTSVYAGC